MLEITVYLPTYHSREGGNPDLNDGFPPSGMTIEESRHELNKKHLAGKMFGLIIIFPSYLGRN
tara:strand:+ start:1223 stop:1411 length:189 start_codon:yes stop_codon:yes gene_type:complete